MLTMHPTLLVGPADWNAARMPKDEFLGRIAALWRACDPSVAGAIVYGGPRHHAELAYLTHFTPKLEAAVALIPRAGEPRLLIGGVNMLGAARPLTWIESLLPLRDAATTITRWHAELGSGGLALINGDAMPFGLRQSIVRALAPPPPDITAIVTRAMRCKSARELALLREACATLDAAVRAMRDAQRAGRGITDTVLAGEQAAHRRGAQDVRTLFGRDATLSPFTGPIAERADPLQVYFAVQHGAYWTEGFAVLASSSPPLVAAAQAILAKGLDMARPGVPHSELARQLANAVGTRIHAVTRKNFGGSIGLSLPEPGCLNEESEQWFAAGEVYTMRAGLRDGASSAIMSAMVAITDRGADVLWTGAVP